MEHFLGEGLGLPQGWTHSLESDSRGQQLRFLRGEMKGYYLAEGVPEEVWFTGQTPDDEDGFWCSIDRPWQEPEDPYPMPMELKSTRYSAAKPIQELFNYMCQAATYTVKKAWKMDGHIDLDRVYHAYLYALFEQGDYKGDRLPEDRAFQLEWTGQELLDWDGEITRRHDELVKSFHALTELLRVDRGFQFEAEKVRDWIPTETPEAFLELLPPITDHYTWECSDYGECPLVALIGCPGKGDDSSWKLPFKVTEELLVREEHTAMKKKKTTKKEKEETSA